MQLPLIVHPTLDDWTVWSGYGLENERNVVTNSLLDV